MVLQQHVAGAQGARLANLIKNIPAERCLVAAIDVAKASWWVMAANFRGEVILPGAAVIADEAGYAELRKRIEDSRELSEAQFLRVGIESAGHYHETLASRLIDDGYDVICHNPSAVKQARGESGKRRKKSDDEDAKAIWSLTMRGLGSVPYFPSDAIGDLQVAHLGREALLGHHSALRNQIVSLLDLIWPGATACDKERGISPILADMFCKTGMALMRLGPDPRKIAALSPAELQRKLRAKGANPHGRTVKELVARARLALMPCGPVHPRIELLQRFLDAYEAVDKAMAAIEAAEADALAKTPGRMLVSVKGLEVVSASGYAAFVGDPRRFEDPLMDVGLDQSRREKKRRARIWRAIGADPARGQSGPYDPNLPMAREGSSWGRAAMMKATASLISGNPVFRDYSAERKAAGKVKKISKVAAAHKANRLLCTLMMNASDYDLAVHLQAVAEANERRPEPSNRNDPGSTTSSSDRR